MLKKHFILIIGIATLIILLLKNPFSERTLIPNMEPFPDALYYVNTPLCFVRNFDWKMCRHQENTADGIESTVPPLYSITLLPSIFITNDPRGFYFTNILLSIFSLVVFYKITIHLFKSKLIISILTLLYVTNYFIYWLPNLAMAENLLILIYLVSVYIILIPINKKSIIFASLIPCLFYGTKFSTAPLLVTFFIFYLYKIYNSNNFKNEYKKFTFLSLLFFAFNFDMKNIFETIFEFKKESSNIQSSPSFSTQYFIKNFIEYKKTLLGESQRFLWDYTPMLEKWVQLPSYIGFIWFIKTKKDTLLTLYLSTTVITQLIFMSFFYSVDARYVYIIVPTFIIFFGMYLDLLNNKILKSDLNKYVFSTIIILMIVVSSFLRIKKQVAINLKYSESPWWYLSIIESNTFFTKQEKKPFLITLAAPFLIDFYSNNNYIPLPLNIDQDFRGHKKNVWGDFGDYSNLINLYKYLLDSGNDIYVTNFGTNAHPSFGESFQEIEKNFVIKKVKSGCYETCNIYRLEKNI